MTPETPEARARALLDLLESDFGQSGRDVRFYAIRDEIDNAMAQEREACARVAEQGQFNSVAGCLGEQVAKAIRSRK